MKNAPQCKIVYTVVQVALDCGASIGALWCCFCRTWNAFFSASDEAEISQKSAGKITRIQMLLPGGAQLV